MFKLIDLIKARFFEKKAESTSVGTILAIVISVVAGITLLTVVFAKFAPYIEEEVFKNNFLEKIRDMW